MAELLGKGVGSWTSREDADFSNFILQNRPGSF